MNEPDAEMEETGKEERMSEAPDEMEERRSREITATQENRDANETQGKASEMKERRVQERKTATPSFRTQGPEQAEILRLDEGERRNIMLALFLLVSAVLTITIFAALVSPESDGETEHSRLQIDEVFPVLRESDNTTYTFDFVIFVTNTEKGEAKNVEIQLAGVDYESKITYAIANTTLPKIPGERSQEAHVLITVPRVKTYKIRIMVFENNEIELKGYCVVSPGSTGIRKDFRVDSFGPGYESKSEETSSSGSAFTAISLVLFFVVLLVEVIAVGSSMSMTELRSALHKVSSNLRR